MKANSGHFMLDEGVEYRDLADAFPELLTTFLQETEQMPDDEEVMAMYIHLNKVELEKNRKPEGYNRKGRMRMVFPLTGMSFYVRGTSKSAEVVRVTEKISKFLNKKGVKHEVEYNRLSCVKE
jgi:hypothetical protein